MGGFVVVLGFFVLDFVVSCRFFGAWGLFHSPVGPEDTLRF